MTSYIFFPIIISISVDTIVSIVKLDAVKVAGMPSAEKLAMLLLCMSASTCSCQNEAKYMAGRAKVQEKLAMLQTTFASNIIH